MMQTVYNNIMCAGACDDIFTYLSGKWATFLSYLAWIPSLYSFFHT